jgi:DNA binding domain, excisionase family
MLNLLQLDLIGGDFMPEKWSGIEEVAVYLDVTKDTIRNWIKKTDIPAHKIGRQWKFKLSEIDEWVRSGKSAID